MVKKKSKVKSEYPKKIYHPVERLEIGLLGAPREEVKERVVADFGEMGRKAKEREVMIIASALALFDSAAEGNIPAVLMMTKAAEAGLTAESKGVIRSLYLRYRDEANKIAGIRL